MAKRIVWTDQAKADIRGIAQPIALQILKTLARYVRLIYGKLIQAFTNEGILLNFKKWITNLKEHVNNQKTIYRIIHSQKLSNLGIKISKSNNLIYNLSSKMLSPDSIKLLEKGPKFVINCKASFIHDIVN